MKSEKKNINDFADEPKELLLRNTLIDIIPAQIFWKDNKLVYLGCNQAFIKSLGLQSKNDVIGKTDFDLPVSKIDSIAFRKDDREVLKSGKPKLNIEERQKLNDGTDRILLTSKVPLLNEYGETYGILAIYYDITERKQMEQELLIAKEKAEAASQSKSVLISNMGHDLKTPFIGIEGNAKILCDNYDEQEPFLRELWDDMLGGIIEIKKIISEIIEATAIENPSVKGERFSINQTLEEIKALLLATAQSKKIDLIISKLDSNESDIIETDKLRFKLILNNFASNALKFTYEGHITFTALRKSDYFHIKVTDTGIGIPHDQVNNIFELFTKLSPSNIHNTFQGIGSGLTSAKTKAEELGAIIEVESELGKGSTFTLIIPVHPKIIHNP